MSRRRTLADVSQFLARCLSAWYSQGRCSARPRPRGESETERNIAESARRLAPNLRREKRDKLASSERRTCTSIHRRDAIFDACATRRPKFAGRPVSFFAFSLLLRCEARTPLLVVPTTTEEFGKAPGSTASFQGRHKETLAVNATLFSKRVSKANRVCARVYVHFPTLSSSAFSPVVHY